MTSLDLVKTAARALDDKKAKDIRAIAVRELTIVTDYFLMASGDSVTQTKALADEVEYRLSQQGLQPARIEGYQEGSWIILDYLELVVHIFTTQTREFYSLERLWSDGQQLDLTDVID